MDDILMKTLLFYLSLPRSFNQLKQLIGHLQPVGKIGEIQKIFRIKYESFDSEK